LYDEGEEGAGRKSVALRQSPGMQLYFSLNVCVAVLKWSTSLMTFRSVAASIRLCPRVIAPTTSPMMTRTMESSISVKAAVRADLAGGGRHLMTFYKGDGLSC
jgi:hypothetical protein